MSTAELPAGARALIFDMDGVIIDSTPVHNEAWQIYLGRHGIDEVQASIEKKMLGKHNDDIVRIFFGDALSAEQIARHGADKERVYREIMGPRLSGQLVAGVAEFLARNEQVPKGVATNAEPANVSFVLERSGLARHFRVVVDGGNVARPKPDPDVYLLAAERLGVPPAECVVFEDSDTGVRAARQAGARVVGLTTTSPRLEGCDITVADFLDPRLAAWLSNN